jgi:hypothetical protein
MAYDESNAVYHLTPRGFEGGDRPADAVETWEREMYQASEYSREQVSWTCIWAGPNVPNDLRQKVKTVMGTPGRTGWRETMIGSPL